MKSVIRPAARLASFGVLLTAGLLTLIGVGALVVQGKWQVGLMAQVLFVGAMLSTQMLQQRFHCCDHSLVACLSGFSI